MSRYIIQPSTSIQDGWVCTDTEYRIVTTWRNGRFNETQKVTMLEDYQGSVMELARLMREMGDWLAANHRDKVIFTTHGGKREGAGRKPIDNRRVTLNARVLPSTLTSLRQMSERDNKSIGAIIDDLTNS